RKSPGAVPIALETGPATAPAVQPQIDVGVRRLYHFDRNWFWHPHAGAAYRTATRRPSRPWTCPVYRYLLDNQNSGGRFLLLPLRLAWRSILRCRARTSDLAVRWTRG